MNPTTEAQLLEEISRSEWQRIDATLDAEFDRASDREFVQTLQRYGGDDEEYNG